MLSELKYVNSGGYTVSKFYINEVVNKLKYGLAEVSREIESCDAFYSCNGLSYLMKKHSINRRFEYFLLCKVTETRARSLILCDMYARLIYQVVRDDLVKIFNEI